MEYKITCLDLLKSELHIQLLIALIYIISFIYIIKFKKSKKSFYYLLLAIFITYAFLLFTKMDTCIYGNWYGYEFNGTHFHLKTWPVDEIIEVRDCSIFLTNSTGWKPKLRTFGYKADDLKMGYYVLNNDIKAIVFMHKTNSPLLIINCSNRYYVISHPGVEKWTGLQR